MRWVYLAVILWASTLAMAQGEKVLFSSPGGFYEDCFELSLDCFYSNHHIRYTTNGATPTAESPRYNDPLYLDERLFSTSDIYTIPICPEFLFHVPESVRHAIVIRAAVFDEMERPISEVVTHTYLIHALGCDTHGLPYVSIAADSLALFDYNTGILVPGVNFDPNDSLWTGNYYQRGDEWERRINIEFHEPDNHGGINQEAGLRTHGGTGRRGQQKGLKVYARKEYGEKRFQHPFFKELPIESYKHLVLKPFSCQWFREGIQDDICNHIASVLDMETVASRPTVLFLNGEYWGIYYLKERPDAHFLEDHFGNEDTEYNVMESWSGALVDGDPTDFNHLMSWLATHHLDDPQNFERLCEWIDLDNFIDYYCLELFIANHDWPSNNMRCYQWRDSRWRWVFYDGDDALLSRDFDIFDNATSETGTGWPTDPNSTLMFRRLLENDTFKEQFYLRFKQLLSTQFAYRTTRVLFDQAADRVSAEIPQQADRFNMPHSFDDWEYAIADIDRFLVNRGADMDYRLHRFLRLDNSKMELLKVYPNPFIDHVVLELHSERWGLQEARVYDLAGRKVLETSLTLTPGTSTCQTNLSLAPGCYIIEAGGTRKTIIHASSLP